MGNTKGLGEYRGEERWEGVEGSRSERREREKGKLGK